MNDEKIFKEKSCGAVIFKDHASDSDVLIIRQLKGHWCFSKGHTKDGETEEETALREIKEETGLLVDLDTAFRYEFHYEPRNNVDKTVVYFVAYKKGGKERIQRSELLDMEWVRPVVALGSLTYESDADLLKKAMEYREAEW